MTNISKYSVILILLMKKKRCCRVKTIIIYSRKIKKIKIYLINIYLIVRIQMKSGSKIIIFIIKIIIVKMLIALKIILIIKSKSIRNSISIKIKNHLVSLLVSFNSNLISSTTIRSCCKKL